MGKIMKKEVRWGFFTRVLFCFILTFAYLSIIYAASTIAGLEIFSTKRYVTVLLCAIPMSFLYAYIVERLGTGLTDLALAWTHRKTDLSEQFSADMAKARISKGKGQFREALLIVSEVLEKYPDFPEALLLKAQIMWEGYDNKELALRNLDKVMSLVKDDAPIHRWAINYYHEVIKGRKPKN
jgi:tetratricopeptide (TPR) repeat protein